jgi:hypothetical protein
MGFEFALLVVCRRESRRDIRGQDSSRFRALPSSGPIVRSNE